MLFELNSRFSLLEKKCRGVIVVMIIYFSKCDELSKKGARTLELTKGENPDCRCR